MSYPSWWYGGYQWEKVLKRSGRENEKHECVERNEEEGLKKGKQRGTEVCRKDNSQVQYCWFDFGWF